MKNKKNQQPTRRSTYSDKELEEILDKIKPNILVLGVGGAGGNAITRVTGSIQSDIYQTIAINTDAQDLLHVHSDLKLLIGKSITGGLGAGNDPMLGEAAAKESEEEIKKILSGADLVFIVCGLGGGTGTGASPLICEWAREEGSIATSVVTLPFEAEGIDRQEKAKRGLERLLETSDSVVVIPNDKMLEIYGNLSLFESFKKADEILAGAVLGVVEVISKPGLINLDFADVRYVLEEGKRAAVSMAEANGQKKSEEVVKRVINNPLLGINISGAKKALINVIGGEDMDLKEVNTIIEAITSELDPKAVVKWGVQINPQLKNTVRVFTIITNIKPEPQIRELEPEIEEEMEDIGLELETL